MMQTKNLNLKLPEGSDIVDFLKVSEPALKSWDGLKSFINFPGKNGLRKKLRQIIQKNAVDVPAAWESTDPWQNPRMDILVNEGYAPPPLPLDLFGDFWGEVITENAKARSTTKDYVALSLLVTAASLIGNARRGAPTPEWSEATVLWGANIGAPGFNKTQGIKAILDYVTPIEQRYSREHIEAVENWKNECEKLINGEAYETDKKFSEEE